MSIVGDLLLAPARGLLFIFKEIYNRVEEELYDETRILKQLRTLQTSLELGEITEEEYDLAEDKLMERLHEARARDNDQTGQGGE